MRKVNLMIFDLFSSPESSTKWSDLEWKHCLSQAYRVNHVARIYSFLKEQNLQDGIPQPLRWHFTSAYEMYSAHRRDFLYTIEHLSNHLSAIKTEAILLKGAAYALGGDKRVGDGRLFSDIDVFISKEFIASAEQVLKWSGWQYDDKTDYDRSYYLNWMHELPPMGNEALPLSIDVHHHIVPIIARTAFDLPPLTASLIKHSHSEFYFLSPAAQLVHTAMHMLTNDDFSNIFRDALDFYLNFKANQSREFEATLSKLAYDTSTEKHVFRALRLVNQLFDCEMGEDLLTNISECSTVERFIDRLYLRLIRSTVVQDDPKHTLFSTWLLWFRAHWLKMPLPILTYHLANKSWVGLKSLFINTKQE